MKTRISPWLLMLFSLAPLASSWAQDNVALFRQLTRYSEAVTESFDEIDDERKAQLEALGDYIYDKVSADEPVKLTVICTHNSRRSHIGQLWLLVAAHWYGIENLQAFSGGTEATAFNPRAVAALERAGFRFRRVAEGENPTYSASFLRGAANRAGLLLYSKKYDNEVNPSEGFAALMVCSEADRSCPVVPGAEERFSVPFDDPRYFDGTPAQATEYDKTTRQIAQEFFYAVHHAKQRLVLEQEQQKSARN